MRTCRGVLKSENSCIAQNEEVLHLQQLELLRTSLIEWYSEREELSLRLRSTATAATTVGVRNFPTRRNAKTVKMRIIVLCSHDCILTVHVYSMALVRGCWSFSLAVYRRAVS